jgi:hypothetical protein
MENLKYPKKRMLYNSVTADDIISSTAGKLELFDCGVQFNNATDTLEVSNYFGGHKSGSFIELGTTQPGITGVPFEAGFIVKPIEKNTVSKDSNSMGSIGRYFSGTVQYPVFSAGSLDAASKTIFYNSIMEMVIADNSNIGSNFMEIRKAAYISVAAGTPSIILNGTTITAGGTTAAALVTAINAVNGFMAVSVSSTVIFITTTTKAVNFTIANGNVTTILKEGLYVNGTNPDIKASIKADKAYFNIFKQSYVTIDYTGLTVAGDARFYIYTKNPTTGAIIATDVNQVLSGIGAALGTVQGITGVYGSLSSANVLAIASAYLTTTTIVKITTTIQSKVVFGVNNVEFGVFSNFTAAELYTNFVGNYAGMEGSGYMNLPIPNGEYVILNFTKKGTSSTLTGSASGTEGFLTRFELVILKSLFFDSARWDATFKVAGTSAKLAAVINNYKAGVIV